MRCVNRRRFLLATAAVALLRDVDALAADEPVALVTADTESRVLAVGLDGRVRREIATLPGPRSIQAVGEHAVVAHTAAGSLTILHGLRVRHVVGGFDEPRYTAGSPDGRLAYVTDSGRGDVAVVDVAAGAVLARTAVDGPARHVTLSGRQLWVALGPSAGRIAVLDVGARKPTRAGSVTPPFLVHDVGFEPSGRRVWVTSGDNHHRTVLVYERGAVVRRLAAGATPQHVTFAGREAFVSSGDDGAVRVFSLDDGRLLRTTVVPLGSFNVQAAGGVVLTPSLTRGTLCVLDRRGRVSLRERVAASSHDACLISAR
jgi:DNA-binding beta-propeller fold protein YncE